MADENAKQVKLNPDELLDLANQRVAVLSQAVKELSGRCHYCKGTHGDTKCPNLEGIIYYPSGKVRELHFFDR